MTVPASSSDQRDPASGDSIADGVVCVRCGYALVGLDPAGDCPECGTAVIRSLSEDRLADADPEWLARVTVGLGLLAWGPVVMLLAGVAAVFALEFVGAISDPVNARRLELLANLALAIAGVALFAAAAGGLLVTEGEPRDAGREGLDEPRLVARWGLVGAAGLAAAVIAARQAFGPLVPAVTGNLVIAVAVASGGFALAALQDRFRQFAVRIPSPSLAERCTAGSAWYRRWTRFMVGLVLVVVLRDLLTLIPGLGTVRQMVELVIRIGGCVAMVVVLLAGIKLLGILDLALSIRRAARLALRESAQGGARGV